MRKSLIVLLLVCVLHVNNAIADARAAQNLTPAQRAAIARAIRLLTETGTLKGSQDQCLKFDEDVLAILHHGGLIECGDTACATICVGPYSGGR